MKPSEQMTSDQPNPAPTPRTDLDELREHLEALDLNTGMLAELVEKAQAAFAAKDAEIARRKAQIDMWTSAAMDGNAAIAQLTARAEKAEAELAEVKDTLDAETATELCDTCGCHIQATLVESGQCIYCTFRGVTAERDQLRAEVEAKTDRLIAAESMANSLANQIGNIEPHEHPDEQKPRAQTWLQERKNWAAEVAQLRAALAAAQEDTERLIKTSAALLNELDGEAFEIVGTARAEVLYEQAASVRAAIAAARAGTANKPQP